MAEIMVSTDGTITGTKLMVDGKDVTKKEKVVSIEVYSRAPYKSSYSGETIRGMSAVSYETVTEDGKVERKSYGTTDTKFSGGIGQKIKTEDNVVRFIGAEVDKQVSDIVDNIVNHCAETNITCPSREVLLSRSLDSLKDKAIDLGLELKDEEEEDEDADIEDAKKEYYAVKASETSGDEPKYPINNCSDVSDAWKLRAHGKGLKISQETLENRIKRRAKALGCTVPGGDNDDSASSAALDDATGSTSESDGHEHSYAVDRNGNGSTNKVNDHTHTIKNWKVQTKNGHTHSVQVPNKPRRGATHEEKPNK